MLEAAVGEWVPLADWQRLPAAPGIYAIRHLVSLKEYIGQSKNIRKRLASHRAAVSSHYFGRALRAHGLASFETCVLARADEGLGQLEQDFIAARDSMAPAGYNLAAGGDGPTGVKWSDERKSAQSAARTGIRQTDEAKAKQRAARLANNPFKGQKHSAETLAKISAATVRVHTGMKRSAETCQRIGDSKRGKPGYQRTAEQNQAISERMKGRVLPHMLLRSGENSVGYGVKGADHPRAKPVGMWVPGAMVPLIFDTVTEAAAHLGVKPASICDWCVGRYRPKNGNQFAYV